MGSGSANLLSSIGGLAKGMPRNSSTNGPPGDWARCPSTRPLLVSTIGSGVSTYHKQQRVVSNKEFNHVAVVRCAGNPALARVHLYIHVC